MHYRIFDFEIESEVVLPCDAPSVAPEGRETNRWELEIVFRPRPDWIFERAHPIGRRSWGCAYHVESGVLLSVENGIAMYFQADGRRIEVHFDPACPVQSSQVGAWLVNLGMAICQLFRGGIPLHGASVEWHQRLFGVMAASGTGKSTLLWRLLDGGALFCGDDLLPIDFSTEAALATPSGSLHGKLSGTALQSRGMSPTNFAEIVAGTDEFWVPLEASHRTFQKRRPTALFILSPFVADQSKAQETPIIARRHQGADALSHLMANTHGLWATCGLLDSKTLMHRYLQLATEVPIMTLHYARDFAILPRVREALAEIVNAQPISTFP